jgi:hypothetical protein
MAVTDYVKILMDLGALQAEATQRGDDRAVEILSRAAKAILDGQTSAAVLESRRQNERERQRLSRESRDTPEVRSSSKEIVLVNTDYSAGHVTAVTEPDEYVQRLLDLLRGQVGDAEFPAVDAFVRRRPYRVWKGWVDEMLAAIGPGSQYSPADLVRVCKDDAALDRPIGSPRGLRSFLSNARIERLKPSTDPEKPHQGGSGAAAGRVVQQIRALIAKSPTGHRFIPRKKVEELGPDVLRAYDDIGGADRFLNINPEYIGVFVREFSQHLSQKATA